MISASVGPLDSGQGYGSISLAIAFAAALGYHCRMSQNMSQNITTVKDAATLLGLSVRQVRHLCQRGHIAAMLMGRDWVISLPIARQPKIKPGRKPKILSL